MGKGLRGVGIVAGKPSASVVGRVEKGWGLLPGALVGGEVGAVKDGVKI